MADLRRRMRAVWRTLWRSKQLEADMRDEMRFHLQMEADRLARGQAIDPQEARRQAYVRFGGVEKYKEEGREARGLHWLETASLDARLAVRMLAKHRGLAVVGTVAMAVAIAIGASAFEIVGVILRPALPVRNIWRSIAWAVGIVTVSVLLLSAAGVQATMSFTIAQRTREIGIRSALGASPRHLLLGIFGRAMRQLGLGVVVGSLLSVGVFLAAGIGVGPATALLLTVAAVMTVVASLAALGPARRSLRIQTIEALRMEG